MQGTAGSLRWEDLPLPALKVGAHMGRGGVAREPLNQQQSKWIADDAWDIFAFTVISNTMSGTCHLAAGD
jgi:hypothetical protein